MKPSDSSIGMGEICERDRLLSMFILVCVLGRRARAHLFRHNMHAHIHTCGRPRLPDGRSMYTTVVQYQYANDEFLFLLFLCPLFFLLPSICMCILRLLVAMSYPLLGGGNRQPINQVRPDCGVVSMSTMLNSLYQHAHVEQCAVRAESFIYHHIYICIRSTRSLLYFLFSTIQRRISIYWRQSSLQFVLSICCCRKFDIFYFPACRCVFPAVDFWQPHGRCY